MSRNILLSAQALFGLLPAFVLSSELQYQFYQYFFLLSLISIGSLAIESIANIRFPRKKGQEYRIFGYISILILSAVLLTFLFLAYILFLSPTSLILFFILICGLISNFRLLYVSWLRVEHPQRLITLMILEAMINLIACSLLFYIETTLQLALMIICSKVGIFILYIFWDFLQKFSKIHITFKFNPKHIKTLFLSCLIFSVSILLIIHQSTLVRAFYIQTMTPSEFVALSVALSVATNIQKLAISYYWVIQKNIFSSLMHKSFIKQQIFILPILIFIVLALTYASLLVLHEINPSLDFSLTIIYLCLVITIYRLSSSSFRGLILRILGIKYILKKQLTAIFIFLPFLIVFYFLGLLDFTLLFSTFLLTEFLIVYVFPFKDQWNKLPNEIEPK